MNAETLDKYPRANKLLNLYARNKAIKETNLDLITMLEQFRRYDFISYGLEKKIKDNITAIRKTVKQAATQNRKIETIINRVEGTEKDILTARIVRGMLWADIAEQYAYCDRQTFRLYAQGLETLENLLNKGKGVPQRTL